MLVLQDAIGVNRKGVRNRVYAEHLRYGASESTIPILRPSHLVFRDELFPFLLIRIETDAQDEQRLPLKLLGDLTDMR